MLKFTRHAVLTNALNGLRFNSSAAAATIPLTTKIEAIDTERPFSNFLTDTFNRQHTYLRISITEKCNLRCTYCMPAEGVQLSSNDELLTTEEILRLARLFVSQGITKIRLTGGEPTVRPDIIQLVQGIGELKNHGLQQLGMTSNGIALKRKLPSLFDAGMDSLNVSLDTLDKDMFEIITRRKGYERVLESVHQALELGMPSVKINCVVIRGTNDHEVSNFVALTKNLPITVRFIEYMPFDGNRWNADKLVPYKDLIRDIEGKYGRLQKVSDDPNDTTKAYRVPGYAGKVGFITSMSDHFCGTCNRLRITTDGNLKVCLFGAAEVSLRDYMRQSVSDDDLCDIIGMAVKNKKKQHAVQYHRFIRPPSFLSLMPGKSTILKDQTRFYSTDKTPKLTHTDANTGKAKMVSVTSKDVTHRTAQAEGSILLPETTFNLLSETTVMKKGDVLTVAQIAGIQAAKQTSMLIPLCHPLLLSNIQVHLKLNPEKQSVDCTSLVECRGNTGVEMEALTAVNVALLTVYDMCKAAGHGMEITGIKVKAKTGGKSDYHVM
ncbi:hypothetical protein BC943DRAFT_58740 [Umbelopsis sp. AD052]|nr:hypothetical protein BC943DRAFT_58740 [Umbelopsis sp. AD052]